MPVQVGEGEQHAGLIADFDGVAGDNHSLLHAGRKRQAGFHLRNGLAGMEALHSQLALLRAFQHIDLMKGFAGSASLGRSRSSQ